MLVGERMTHPVVFVVPDMTIVDALQLMKKEKIRRVPVVKSGKLIGIVSDKDLLNASPSQATSLSVWELNYLLSKITVAEVEELVPAGSLDPNQIHIPGIFVKRIFQGTRYEKRIEQRTVRNR